MNLKSPPEAAAPRLKAHRHAFESGLERHRPRIIGWWFRRREFDHAHVCDYQPQKAMALVRWLKPMTRWYFEAHSTDLPDAAGVAPAG